MFIVYSMGGGLCLVVDFYRQMMMMMMMNLIHGLNIHASISQKFPEFPKEYL